MTFNEILNNTKLALLRNLEILEDRNLGDIPLDIWTFLPIFPFIILVFIFYYVDFYIKKHSLQKIYKYLQIIIFGIFGYVLLLLGGFFIFLRLDMVDSVIFKIYYEIFIFPIKLFL